MLATEITADSSPLYRWTENKVRCRDCGAWAYDGDPIRHSKRCDFPAEQAKAAPGTATAQPAVEPAKATEIVNRRGEDCRACGRAVKVGKGFAYKIGARSWAVRHRDCAAVDAWIASPEDAELMRLEAVADRVRREGLGGDPEDVHAAVRRGLLSVNDAMNTDD